MPLIIKFPHVNYAINVVRAMSPELGDEAVEQMLEEYDEHGGFNCEAASGDKSVILSVAKVADRARATISGHRETMNHIVRFCQRHGVEYVEE
jgi:hypothetical protein